MPSPAVGYGTPSATSPLAFTRFERRDLNEDDVCIDIVFCGVCHSDLHIARNEWGGTRYPIIPGHEIVGHVKAVGPKVTKFKIGDKVGVGCLVDACHNCASCKRDLEQFCNGGKRTATYGSLLPDGSVTQGGYSDHIVVSEPMVLRVPDNLEFSATAPLLCAGITTFSPLRHYNCSKGTKVGVVGIGGLGHMAVKLAHAMGAEVTVFTTSPGKVEDAKRLGAHHVILSNHADEMKKIAMTLDIIIDTVGTPHPVEPYMETLAIDGAHVLVGLPEQPNPPVSSATFVRGRRILTGSNIGGIAETQEMLDFCGKHNITSDVEMINIDYINEAYERMLKNDVKYRFVIDIASLKKEAAQ